MNSFSKANSGLTVRLPASVKARVDQVARAENRSAAAYIESLIQRDLLQRDEAARTIQVHVAAELPDRSTGTILRGESEAQPDYEARSALLNAIFGI